MESELDVSLWMRRLAHYAFTHVPGPRWTARERADRAKQAHLDGVLATRLAHVLDGDPDRLGDDWLKEASPSEGESHESEAE